MSVFPPEIINEILVRLPVKPLLRFCCVSKLWCALINDPYFIKIHMERSITTKSNRSLYLGYMCTLLSLNLTDLRTSMKLEYLDDYNGGDILGSCNGILLLKIKNGVALFNPATRQYRILPNFPIEYQRGVDRFPVREKYGFGYDSVNDDYKVIRVIELYRRCMLTEFRRYYKRYRWISIPEATIFSLKSNSWRKIENFQIENLSYCFPSKSVCGIHLNGCLHNLAHTISNDDDLPYSVAQPETIVAYNLGTETCCFVPLPDLDKSYFCIAVEVFEGCLCVVASYGKKFVSYHTDIWVMRVYGVEESWVKLFTYFPQHVETFTKICPLAFSENGEEVLLDIDHKGVIWYNPEGKSVRIAPFSGRPYPLYVEFGVESNPSYVDVGVESLVPLG